MRDFAVSHANIPAGARLWTFGSSRLVSDDGWTVAGGSIVPQAASLVVDRQAARVTLTSPPDQWIRPDVHRRLFLEYRSAAAIRSIGVFVRPQDGTEWLPVGRRDSVVSSDGAVDIPLEWPAAADPASQMRIEFAHEAPSGTLAIARIALLP